MLGVSLCINVQRICEDFLFGVYSLSGFAEVRLKIVRNVPYYAFSFPVSANMNVRKLHATAGMGLSKTPTAEIELSLCGSAVSSVSKVTCYLRCTRWVRAWPVRVKIYNGRSGIYYEKGTGVIDSNVRENFKCSLAQD